MISKIYKIYVFILCIFWMDLKGTKRDLLVEPIDIYASAVLRWWMTLGFGRIPKQRRQVLQKGKTTWAMVCGEGIMHNWSHLPNGFKQKRSMLTWLLASNMSWVLDTSHKRVLPLSAPIRNPTNRNIRHVNQAVRSIVLIVSHKILKVGPDPLLFIVIGHFLLIQSTWMDILVLKNHLKLKTMRWTGSSS